MNWLVVEWNGPIVGTYCIAVFSRMDVQSLLARCMLESTNQSLLARLENVTFFFSGMCILLYIIVYYCIYIAGDCDEDGVEKRAPTGTRGLAEAQPFLPGSR